MAEKENSFVIGDPGVFEEMQGREISYRNFNGAEGQKGGKAEGQKGGMQIFYKALKGRVCRKGV